MTLMSCQMFFFDRLIYRRNQLCEVSCRSLVGEWVYYPVARGMSCYPLESSSCIQHQIKSNHQHHQHHHHHHHHHNNNNKNKKNHKNHKHYTSTATLSGGSQRSSRASKVGTGASMISRITWCHNDNTNIETERLQTTRDMKSFEISH